MRSIVSAILLIGLSVPLYGQTAADGGNKEPIATQLSGGGLGLVPVEADPEKTIPREAPVKPKPDKRVVNRVAATVNGRPITSSEVTLRLLPIAAQLAAMYPRQGPEFQKQLAQAKKSIIQDLIERELVLSDFEIKGYQMRESFIDQEINRVIIEDCNGNRDLFIDNLNKAGMTIRGFRDVTKRRMIVASMRASKYDQDIPPTPDEINKEYAKIKSMFRDITKDRIKFKKIFIPIVGSDPTFTPEVQLELAELIAKEIKGKKETFENMAKEYSKDHYAEKGGDWPEVERSQMSPEFASIIFDAKIGQVVGPLVDPYGFTIIVVESKKLAPPPPLSKIREEIDTQVRTNRSNERYKQWVQRLRDKAIIKVYI